MKAEKKNQKPLGEILVEQGIITRMQLDKSLEEQKKEEGLIGETVVRLGFAKEEDIAHCLSLQYGFPYLPLQNYEIPKEITRLVPRNVAEHYCLIPIDKIENTITVAMANPLNEHAIEDVSEITSCEVQVFVSTPSDIRKSIENSY